MYGPGLDKYDLLKPKQSYLIAVYYLAAICVNFRPICLFTKSSGDGVCAHVCVVGWSVVVCEVDGDVYTCTHARELWL
jgi:hypothetical protein